MWMRAAKRLGIGLTSFVMVGGCGPDERSVGLFGDEAGDTSTDAGDRGDASTDGGSTGAGPAGPGDGPGGVDDSSGDDDGIKLDVGVWGDVGHHGECGCGNDEWTYIWVSNSSQGTVSKINTRTMVEEGRYRTRPDGGGSPSRTSVSLGGRAVAVANRHGGVTKVWAREQFCDPNANGQPGLQTSQGAADIRAWGDDDCVAWHTPFPEWTTQRPIAWGGKINPATCDDDVLWTAGCGGGFQPGFGGASNTLVVKLDGATGAILDTVEVVGFGCGGLGPYGGAVDGEGNFWIAHNGTGGKLARIDGESLVTQVYDFPGNGFAGYGIAVDNHGRPWVSSYGGDLGAGMFDPTTQQWTTVAGFASQGGIQQGTDGRIWSSTVSGFGGTNDQNGVVWIDEDTLAVGDFVAVPGGTIKGISVDVDGYVWAVTGSAHKIDPDPPYAFDGSYSGLSGPYTYSDMTGWGLQNATCNPAG
jgi:hypothetical protein